MTNQSFLQKFFSVNPTIEQISHQAIELDDRAQYHLNVAAKAHTEHNDAITVRHNQIAIDMLDTADALRRIVCEAAQYLTTPVELAQLTPSDTLTIAVA